jgi:putative ABC transport system ATP-binding protein
MLTLVCGLRRVMHGSVRTLDHELQGATSAVLVRVRRSIGFIFQAHNLLGALTACQNVQMSLQLEPGVSAKESRRRAVAMLAAVGLEERLDHYPNQLSGGQKQRVAIARALVRRPQIVLADEPTAALDKASGREVVELLRVLAKEQGCAILLVTHDNRILDVADRIVTLEDGRISSFASGLGANAEHLLTAYAQMHRNGELRRHLKTLPQDAFARELGEVTAEFAQMLQTIDLANAKATSQLLDEVLESAADRIRDLLHADRTTVYLVDRLAGRMHSKIAQHGGDAPLEISLTIGEGIAGRVAETGQARNIPDAQRDPAFNPDVDRHSGYTTRSMLCLPVRSRAGTVIGVVQVLNKQDGGAFDASDEKAFDAFAPSLGVILETCGRLLSTMR